MGVGNRVGICFVNSDKKKKRETSSEINGIGSSQKGCIYMV